MVGLIPSDAWPPNVPTYSGQIIPTYVMAPAFQSQNVVINTLYATPFYVPEDCSIDALVVNNTITGDTGEKLRMGLYSSVNGLPSALLGETGEITLDATADIRIAAMGGAVSCSKDAQYWIAIVPNSATTAILMGTNTAPVDAFLNRSLPAWNAGVPITNVALGGSVAISHTFGALPDPFGSPTATYYGMFLGGQVA